MPLKKKMLKKKMLVPILVVPILGVPILGARAFLAGPPVLINGQPTEGQAVPEHLQIHIMYRGEGKWAIVEGGLCIMKDGSLEHEPKPSSRNAVFKSRAYHASPEDAFAFLAKHQEAERAAFRESKGS